MLKYLVEVLELTCLISLALGALWGSQPCRTPVCSGRFLKGLGAGILAALALSIYKHVIGHVSQETVNFVLQSGAFVALLLCVAGLWLARLTGALKLGAVVLAVLLPLYALTPVFGFPYRFVLADQSAFSDEYLFKLAGFLLALLLSLLLLILARLTLKALPERGGRLLITLLLLVVFAAILGECLQYALARRFLPMSKPLFAVVKFSVNEAAVFRYAGIAVALVAAVLLFIQGLRRPQNYKNAAGRRKLLAASLKQRRSALWLAVFTLTALGVLTLGRASLNRGFELSPAEAFTLKDGVISIPLTQVSDHHLHRFAYQASDGTEVRFIIVQKTGSSFGIGLDACEICGSTGYYERDGQVVCMLCDVVMNINTIGYRGGCNPIPFDYSIDAGAIQIAVEALEKESGRFK